MTDPWDPAPAGQILYVPIARHAYSQTEDGGLHPGWVMLVGFLAPTEKVTFDVHVVRYVRPW